MKIKILLPVERQGVIVMHGQPEQSFYQLVHPLLEQFNINVHDYILKDSYGKEHSMAKPMG